MRATVIVPTYNRNQELCHTLHMLLSQDYPQDDYEIIVVDQTMQHDEETDRYINSIDRPNFKRHILARPSLPGARNVGVSKASGEVIIFVDDDVEPGPSFVRDHVACYTDQSIGGVAGRRIVPGATEHTEKGIGIILSNSGHIGNFSACRSTEVEWASGCNMSFRRSVLDQAGPFEPRFIGTAIYEDVDMCFRVRALGYRIVFSPQASLLHLVASQGGCAARERNIRYYYSMVHNSLLFAFRNRSPRQIIHTLLSNIILLGVLLRRSYHPVSVLKLVVAFPRAVISHAVAGRELGVHHGKEYRLR